MSQGRERLGFLGKLLFERFYQGTAGSVDFFCFRGDFVQLVHGILFYAKKTLREKNDNCAKCRKGIFVGKKAKKGVTCENVSWYNENMEYRVLR